MVIFDVKLFALGMQVVNGAHLCTLFAFYLWTYHSQRETKLDRRSPGLVDKFIKLV